MARLTSTILLLFFGGVGFSQSTASVGDVWGVDIRTLSVQWNRNGRCLAYTREVDSGIAIGLYSVGSPQGSPLLRLSKTDVWRLQWFESQDAAILTVTNSDRPQKHIAVYLLEARPATATKLIEQTAPPGEDVNIDGILSPLLEHAIFYVHVGDLEYHLVLPLGGTALIRSTDLDEAQRRGLVGPKWASSGTAFYLARQKVDAPKAIAGDSPRDLAAGAVAGTDTERTVRASSADGTIQIQLTVRGQLQVQSPFEGQIQTNFDSQMLEALLNTLRTAPPVGDVGIELMPTNGVLRQVRSPGPWQEPSRKEIDKTPFWYSANVTAGQLVGRSQSLWLVPRDKSQSTLVAPSAQNSWLSPTGRAIAYTVDGALFVRPLN